MTIQLGVQNLEVELDAKVVLDLISSRNSPNAAYSSLLFDCRLLLDKIPHTIVKHEFREANKCANVLVRKGCNLQEELVNFGYPSSDEIAALMSADKNGESFCRHVATNLAILAV